MHYQRLRERECLTRKATQPLSEGVVPAFNMGSFTGFFAHRTVLLIRDDRGPEVAITRAVTIAGRDAFPQLPTRFCATVTHGIRHNLACPATQGNPDP